MSPSAFSINYYSDCLAYGRFEDAYAELEKAHPEEKESYRFLLLELFEEFSGFGEDRLTGSNISNRSALIRYRYRVGEDMDQIRHDCQKVLKDHQYSSSFWRSYLFQTMGFTYHSQGSLKQANFCYNKALNIAESKNFFYLQFTTLITILELEMERDNEDRIQKLTDRITNLVSEVDNPFFDGLLLFTLAEYDYLRGQQGIAIELFEDSLKDFEFVGAKGHIARVNARLGRHFRDLGDLERSMEYFSLANQWIENVEGRLIEKMMLKRDLAIAHSLMGDVASALEMMDHSLYLVKQVGSPSHSAELYLDYIQVCDLHSLYEKSERLLDQLNKLISEDNEGINPTYYWLAKAIVLRNTSRMMEFSEHMVLLHKVIQSPRTPFKLRVNAYLYQTEAHIYELNMFKNIEILQDIEKSLNDLIALIGDFQSRILKIQLLLLRGQFAVLGNEIQSAEDVINLADELIRIWKMDGLTPYLQKLSDRLAKRITQSKSFLREFEKSELAVRVKSAELLSYLKDVKSVLQGWQ